VTTETALPVAAPVEASEQPSAEQLVLTEKNRAIDEADPQDPARETKEEPQAKPEKTADQREIERLRRGIDRRTRQLAEARAQVGLHKQPIEAHNAASADDSEPLSLTRAQLREMVNSEAERLAPTLREQANEVERRRGVVTGLAKTWGTERFNDLSSDLDAAFDGLKDANGNPKPSVEAIFEADDAAKVIEYLANPEHDDEAEAISRMSAAQAGKAIAKLEARIASETAQAKPKPSKAPAPLEPVRGGGNALKAWMQLGDKEFIEHRRKFSNKR
jgi:hypothetical protein